MSLQSALPSPTLEEGDSDQDFGAEDGEEEDAVGDAQLRGHEPMEGGLRQHREQDEDGEC